MDLSGYFSSKPGPQVCDQYALSGQYTAGDFIQKTFTGLPLNHYQVVVRFGIGYIGSWNQADQMRVHIDGQLYTWTYNTCYDPQNLCGSSGTDCFKIVERIISHDTANLTLRFSSAIPETNPLVKYWGVKDLTIGIRTCNSKCQTCFGPGHADCISCALGYFLLGNLCVRQCEYFALVDKRMCIEKCPTGFFGSNQTKVCEACVKDCLVCSDGNTCSVWSNDKEGLVWEQNKFFWILLLIMGFFALLYLVWKLILQKRFTSRISDNNQLKKSIISEDGSDEQPKKRNEKEVGTEKILPEKSTTNLTSSDLRQQKKVHFEEYEAPWNYESPRLEEVMKNSIGHQIPKRKKKKLRPLVIEQHSNASIPSIVQLDSTIDKPKL